jgi:lipopolysaccharide/colanic/teichoic acid biosynthesis glycosyltransferase
MSPLAKRFTDIIVSGSALLIFSPLILLIALAIGLSTGRPVLFRQMRPGYKGKPFTLLKFRTMTAARNARGLLLPDAERLTKIGKLLRQLSLDELPQLWNVFRGDMSLVGPRPLLMQYLDRYTPRQARRHEVKPGITGWAQVNGRNVLTWEQKFTLDLWYVDHWSLLLDFRILLQTMLQVLTRRGISFEGYATMPEFMGSQNQSARGCSK